MAPDTLIFGYFALLMGGLAGLGLYYEHREKQFGPTRSRDKVFRCERCGFVYTDDADVDRSRCPQCGATNGPFEF